MLGVTFKTDGFVAKQKKKKKDKKSRAKKSKRERNHRSDSSSDSDSGGPKSPQVEALAGADGKDGDPDAVPAAAAAPLVREEWMTKPKAAAPKDAATAAAEAEAQEEKEKAAAEPEIFEGLRIMKKAPEGADLQGDKDSGQPSRASLPAAPPASAKIGDGGLSWRMKALARAKVQAKEGGTSLAAVVSERWGSLSGLTSALTQGRAADDRAHLSAARSRQRDAERVGAGAQRPHYLDDIRSEQGQMKRPAAADNNLSWRGRDNQRDNQRDSQRGREGEQRDEQQGGNDGRDGETGEARPDNEDRPRGGRDGRGGEKRQERPGDGDRPRGGNDGRDGEKGEARQDDRGRPQAERDNRDGEKREGRPHDRGRPQAERDSRGGEKREAQPDDRDRPHGGRDGQVGEKREARLDDRDRPRGGRDRGGGEKREGRLDDRGRPRGGSDGRDGEKGEARRDDQDKRHGGRDGEQGEGRPYDRDRPQGGGDGEKREEWKRPVERLHMDASVSASARPGGGSSREQSQALLGLADQLNEFDGDGSFLEKFQQRQQQQQAAGGGSAAGRHKQIEGGEDGDAGGPSDRERRDGEPAAAAAAAADGLKGALGSSSNTAAAALLRERAAAAAAAARASAPSAPEAASGGAAAGISNKSVAEMLRARLKGLPTPALPLRASVPAPDRTTLAAPLPQHRASVAVAGGSSQQRDTSCLPGRGNVRRPGLQSGRDGGSSRSKRDARGGGGDGSDSGGSSSSGAGERLPGRRPRGGSRKGRRGSSDGEEDDEPGSGSDGFLSRGSDEDKGHRPGAKRGKPEVVNLPMVDAQGRATKGAFGRDAAGLAAPEPGCKAKKVQRFGEDGKKTRYFADDDDVDLATLVKRTKYGDDGGAADLDSAVASNIAKQAKFKATDLDVDAEYDFDGGLEMYESRKGRGTREQLEKRERDRQVSQYARGAKLEDRCMYCPTSSRRPRHLSVSLAHSSYLMLPDKGRLAPGHCCIVVADHVPSMRQVDDPVWTEVKNFMKCLIQMFASKGQQCIFMETAMNVRSQQPHAVLECVPVGDRELDQAPAYFKKAMLEAESEWSTHHAKAVIETTVKKGLRESVPVGFPYMYVQYGYGKGMLHVIDDESKFDGNLGRQVLIGLLRLPPEDMHRRGRGESVAVQERQVAEFKAGWDQFDWTKQLQD